MKKSDYAASGVDIDAGNKAVELMKSAVKSTYGPEVLAGIGSFGGLFDVSALKVMKNPVLVASTDGVGTKVKLAAQAGRFTPSGTILSTIASTISWCRAPARCSFWTILPLPG
jgi:phosphoribosylformylglycinamidine cyclo-ligase